MKKYIIILVIVLIILITFQCSFAMNTNVNINLDGNDIEFNNEFGRPFIDENSRTLVPFRAVLEQYGAVVSWDSINKEAICEYNNSEIRIVISENIIYKNNYKYYNDTNALIKDGRTYIPIRLVIELLGGKVNYDANTKTVMIKHANEVLNKVIKNDKFLYQLQSLNIQEVINNKFEIVVMDYSKDGSDEFAYESNEILKMKNFGVTPLAYISIGESEDYRYYFTDGFENNSFVGRENSEWEGNYKVRYWNENWQNVIFDYLDKIIDAGFDGAYLDIVDGYEYWGDKDNKEYRLNTDPLNEEEAAKLMINFIISINKYCKMKNENFLIIPQNGVDIIKYDDGEYIKNIDGIGIESLFYDELNKKKEEEISKRLNNIMKYKNFGKFVLVTDYIDDGNGIESDNLIRINDFIKNINNHGFKYYIGNKNRELDDIGKYYEMDNY